MVRELGRITVWVLVVDEMADYQNMKSAPSTSSVDISSERCRHEILRSLSLSSRTRNQWIQYCVSYRRVKALFWIRRLVRHSEITEYL